MEQKLLPSIPMKNVMTAAMVFLAMTLLFAGPGVQAGESLTPNQINILENAGLSDNASSALQAMYKDSNRKRDPAMSHDTVLEMLKADMPDDVIRLLIGLDWLTSRDSRMPLPPGKVMDLYASGADLQTIRVMLASEISKVTEKLRKQNKDLDESGWNAVPENEAPRQPGILPEQEMPLLPDPQAEMEDLRLGRQKLTRPDGKEVIVYRSPFEDHSTRLGRQTFTKPDGKQTIIYRSPFDEPRPARIGRVVINRPDGKQIVVYTSADPRPQKKPADLDSETPFSPEDIMDKLRLHIDLTPYMP